MKKRDPIATDYSNRFNRRLWLTERRSDLLFYFESRNLVHGRIATEAFWSVVPRTSIWQIPSLGAPGFDGWFGIAGDHPTDVVPMNNFDGDPRKVLDHFVNKWLHASSRLKGGDDYGDFRIEQIDQRPAIGLLIEDRAKRIQRWVETEELWPSQPLSPESPPGAQADQDLDEA